MSGGSRHHMKNRQKKHSLNLHFGYESFHSRKRVLRTKYPVIIPNSFPTAIALHLESPSLIRFSPPNYSPLFATKLLFLWCKNSFNRRISCLIFLEFCPAKSGYFLQKLEGFLCDQVTLLSFAVVAALFQDFCPAKLRSFPPKFQNLFYS